METQRAGATEMTYTLGTNNEGDLGVVAGLVQGCSGTNSLDFLGTNSSVLSFRDTVTEEDNLGRRGLGVGLKVLEVGDHHLLKIGDDLHTTLLETDAGLEANVVTILASNSDSNRWLELLPGTDSRGVGDLKSVLNGRVTIRDSELTSAPTIMVVESRAWGTGTS